MNKKEIIDQILDIEMDMFLSVKVENKVSCQENPKAFRHMREAQFSVWSPKTLSSYRSDLQKAQEQDRNLMTLKYARMDNLVPPLNHNLAIDLILNARIIWQKELAEKYPHLIRQDSSLNDEDNSGSPSFKIYLKCELETYSDQTLKSLLEDIRNFQSKGENMTEKVYEHMVKSLGYRSLGQADEAAQRKEVK
jgi:hypothetical protein